MTVSGLHVIATRSLAMTALQLKRLGCLKIESNNKAHPSCPDLILASINLRKTVFQGRWIHRVKPGDDDDEVGW
jgi:hypothetical protein